MKYNLMISFLEDGVSFSSEEDQPEDNGGGLVHRSSRPPSAQLQPHQLSRNKNDDRNRNEDLRNRIEEPGTKQGDNGFVPEMPPSPKKSPSISTPTKSHPFLRLAVPRSAKVYFYK
jgi:hypothetical protein